MLLRDERGRTDKSVKETEVLLQKALKLQRETDDEARDYAARGRGGLSPHVPHVLEDVLEDVLEAATMRTQAANHVRAGARRARAAR